MKRMVIVFLSVMVFGSVFVNCKRPTADKNDVSDKVPVKVQTVKLGRVVQSIDYNGDIKAEFEVKVFSKIPDRIEELYVDEGDFVNKGDPIAKIFAATIEQGVRQAEARLAAAKAQESNLLLEYDRAKRLSKENAMSKQQYDTIEAQYQSTQAQVEQAEAALASIKSQLQDATVTAPISGIIGQRFYEAGDMAAPQLPIVTIVQMDRVKIHFNVTESDLGKLKIGQEAQVKVESYPEQIFKGKVSKISPVLDPLTRMAKVEVLVDNRNKKLKPGMFARVTVITGVLKDVIAIPRYPTIERTSLKKINGQNIVVKNYSVFVVNEGVAHQRDLKVEYVNHDKIAVRSGLQVGDKIVVEGQNNLRDGMPVNVVEEGSDS